MSLNSAASASATVKLIDATQYPTWSVWTIGLFQQERLLEDLKTTMPHYPLGGPAILKEDGFSDQLECYEVFDAGVAPPVLPAEVLPPLVPAPLAADPAPVPPNGFELCSYCRTLTAPSVANLCVLCRGDEMPSLEDVPPGVPVVPSPSLAAYCNYCRAWGHQYSLDSCVGGVEDILQAQGGHLFASRARDDRAFLRMKRKRG